MIDIILLNIVVQGIKNGKLLSFIDESIFFTSNKGNTFVWLLKEMELRTQYILKKSMNNSNSCFWIVSYQGLLIIKRVTRFLNSDNDIKLLDQSFQEINSLGLVFAFQQDCALCHTLVKTMNWLNSQNITPLDQQLVKGVNLSAIESSG
ncbi:hypothetical protein ABPG73_008310 [Tetrahymena malaccensis]